MEYLESLKSKDLKYKTIPIDVKNVDEEKHTITVYTSLKNKDRAGEVVDPKEFDFTNYNKHKIFLANHWYMIENVIGKELERGVDDKGLWQTFEYFTDYEGTQGELAKWAWYLATKGVGAFSIGYSFKNSEYNKEEKATYLKDIELYEVSQVAIPCNQEATQGSEYNTAMMTAYKSFASENEVSNEFKAMFKNTDIETRIKELEKTQNELKREIMDLRNDEVDKDTPVLAEDKIDFITKDETLDFIKE